MTARVRLALLAMLVAATAAHAQPPDLSRVYRERRALVIGINAYTHWKTLGYARSDAEAVGKKLESLGFRVDYLLDRKATRDAIIARLSELSKHLDTRDQVFIYFSGHGQTEESAVSKEKLGYLVPADGRPDDLFQTAISMATLQVLAKRLRAKHVMFALDACFSGALISTKGPGGTRERTPAYFREMLERPVRFVLTAGTATQEAYEVGGQGVFTRHLLAALEGGAARFGDAGVVTASDIAAFVARRVIEDADSRGRKLTPQFGPMIGEGDGEFLLALRSAPRPPARPDIEEEVRQALGALAFTSPVAGVEVWIDGRRVGEVRAGRALVRNNLPVGSYRIHARKDGHREWERVVQVAADTRTDVFIDIAPLGPAAIIKGDDGAEMVLVPAGDFWMGTTREEFDRASEECRMRGLGGACVDWFERELPRHRVTLAAFYIDRYEVTNALFERFVSATGYRTIAERDGYGAVVQRKDDKLEAVKVDGADWKRPRGPGTSGETNHPVVQVSWHDAEAYCHWAGKRLPTEAEWEKAARGIDGRRYPWGEEWDPSKSNGDISVKGTRPVGSYPAGVSPNDAHDMAGNVAEWVADWFDKGYYKKSPTRDPRGPSSGQLRVVRGGSWEGSTMNLRSAARESVTPDGRGDIIGFRCARDPR